MKKTVIFLTILLSTLASGQLITTQQKPMLGLQINWGHSFSEGLVSCWLFNEGSGNKVFDLSGNGNTGTFNSDVSWYPGKFGSCCDFAGNADYISAGMPPGIVDALTIVAWIKYDTKTDEVGILRLKDTFFYIEHPTTGLWFLPDIDGGNNIGVNYSFSAGVWYQVAATYDNSNNGVLYVDGVSIGTAGNLAALDLIGALNVNIGNYNGSGGLWDLDGQIDNLSIYNRALSPSEIARLYREPFCMFEQDDIALMAVEVAAAAGQVIYINMN